MVPYARGVEVNDYQWTDKAYELLLEGKLVVTRSANGGEVIATGQCPRCGHDVDFSFLPTISLPYGGRGTTRGGAGTLGGDSGRPAGAKAAEPEYVTVPILCQCGEEHQGRPSSDRGCGIMFNVEMLNQ